jgi:hypothetical protein
MAFLRTRDRNGYRNLMIVHSYRENAGKVWKCQRSLGSYRIAATEPDEPYSETGRARVRRRTAKIKAIWEKAIELEDLPLLEAMGKVLPLMWHKTPLTCAWPFNRDDNGNVDGSYCLERTLESFYARRSG